MAATLKLELVSPERLLVSEQVEMVIVPGTEGVFGVLPLHAPTLSSLRLGTVDVYQNGAIAQRFAVSGGFAEVTPESCTILVSEALTDVETAQRLAKLTEAWTAEKDPIRKAELEPQVLVAQALADAFTGKIH